MATETKTLKNGNIMEVTSNVGTLSLETINPGFDNEKFKFSFSGRAVKNKPITIGTIKISNDDTTKKLKVIDFKKKFIGINSQVKIKFKKSTLDANGNIDSMLYDIIYTSKGAVAKSDELTYVFSNNRSASIPTALSGVSSIIYGSSFIRPEGELRRITFKGAPGTEVKLTVTKLVDQLDSSGDIVATTHENFTDKFNQGIIQLQNGSTIKGSKITLDSTGNTSVTVKFPKVTLKTRYAISVHSDTMSTAFKTRALLDGGFDDSRVLDRTNPGIMIPQFYIAVLSQFLNPVLTLRATTNEGAGNVKLTVNGGSDQTFNNSNNVDVTYKGASKRIGRSFSNTELGTYFPVTYVMTALSGAFSAKSGSGGAVTFTNSLGDQQTTENTFGAPVFSNLVQTSSDWTNSVASKNGGLDIKINSIKQTISTVSSSNDTLTLSFKVWISSWGEKDVTMALAFNHLITRS